MSALDCRVCGMEHDHRQVLGAEHPVTLTLDDATAKRLLVAACWANEWSVVDAIRHALATGEPTAPNSAL